MNGYVLLADGQRMDGTLLAAEKTAMGFLVANTSVVGFQEMLTDPAYAGSILAFTYPEVGNVGVNADSDESDRVQAAGVVVKVLCEHRSHYLAQDDLVNVLVRQQVPCLAGVDTRGLAVRLRQKGEMPAAIAAAGTDEKELLRRLASLKRPEVAPMAKRPAPAGQAGPTVAVVDLGARNSLLGQLALCSRPVVFPYDAGPEAILSAGPAGVLVSDGPGGSVPPPAAVETVAGLLGKVPLMGCGLGHVALGVAAGCKPAMLKRGHHGANYPVRNVIDGRVEVTEQRHTVMLDRDGVESCPRAGLLLENLNDRSVEGILARDGSFVGIQTTLAAPAPGTVNPHLKRFVDRLSGA